MRCARAPTTDDEVQTDTHTHGHTVSIHSHTRSIDMLRCIFVLCVYKRYGHTRVFEGAGGRTTKEGEIVRFSMAHVYIILDLCVCVCVGLYIAVEYAHTESQRARRHDGVPFITILREEVFRARVREK